MCGWLSSSSKLLLMLCHANIHPHPLSPNTLPDCVVSILTVERETASVRRSLVPCKQIDIYICWFFFIISSSFVCFKKNGYTILTHLIYTTIQNSAQSTGTILPFSLCLCVCLSLSFSLIFYDFSLDISATRGTTEQVTSGEQQIRKYRLVRQVNIDK